MDKAKNTAQFLHIAYTNQQFLVTLIRTKAKVERYNFRKILKNLSVYYKLVQDSPSFRPVKSAYCVLRNVYISCII